MPNDFELSREKLTPRQLECLQMVWETNASSKEISRQIGLSRYTIDEHLAKAMKALGASDRREAARLVFGKRPPNLSGPDPIGMVALSLSEPPVPAPMEMRAAKLPWRSRDGMPNGLSSRQTLAWIAVIAIGSLLALALMVSVSSGLALMAAPLIRTVQRLTR